MKNDFVPFCSEHQTEKEWGPTTFEYAEEGVSVRVSGIFAWVCPVDGEASFTPEGFDELLITVRELLESAKRAKARRSAMTEFVVSVGKSIQEEVQHAT
jgi:RNA polymerase subunit RPABC4/transcription elongation factor Spt4